MSMRRALLLALCSVLAACGGSSSKSTSSSTSTSNAAASQTFTYGSPQSYAGSDASAALTSLSTLAQGTNASGVEILASGDDLADVLLASSVDAATASAGRTALRRALAAARPALGTESFDPSCEVVTANSVTFTGCKFTGSGSGSSTVFTLDGSFQTINQQRLIWNFTWTLSITSSSGTQTETDNEQSDVTVTSTAITGTELDSIALSGNVNGTNFAAAWDESMAIDVTLAQTCATGVVGGTLEAHRVRTAASGLPNAAAKATWTDCGTATIRYGS